MISGLCPDPKVSDPKVLKMKDELSEIMGIDLGVV